MCVQGSTGHPSVESHTPHMLPASPQMINWLDLGSTKKYNAANVPPWLANAVTERWYFQALMRRLRKHTAAQRRSQGATAALTAAAATCP